MYGLLADLVLVLHTLFAAFVVAGLLLVLAGKLLGWRWIVNPWFRWLHLGAILLVVAQAWLGVICPVTNLEMWLRQRAGETTYEGSFITHWFQALLYYDAPPWVFVLAYTVFAALVVLAWVWVRPAPFRRGQ